MMDILKELSSTTKDESSDEGKEFHTTVKEIQELTNQLETIANKVFASNRADLLIKLGSVK